MTNTNLQHYSGESGLSYLSQMLVIIFMMFVSASQAAMRHASLLSADLPAKQKTM